MIAAYGDPLKDPAKWAAKNLRSFTYPPDVVAALPVLGATVYCHPDFWPKYLGFLRLVIKRGLQEEIRTNDECYMPRGQRGNVQLPSMHAFGCAVDFNAADNPRGFTRAQAKARGLRPFSDAFIQCIRDAGMVAGDSFLVPDPMHLEYTR